MTACTPPSGTIYEHDCHTEKRNPHELRLPPARTAPPPAPTQRGRKPGRTGPTYGTKLLAIIGALALALGGIAIVGRLTNGYGTNGPSAANNWGTTRDATYTSIEDFRDAAVTAGLNCPDWHRTDKVGTAEGYCQPDGTDGASLDQLALFANASERDRALGRMQLFAEIGNFGILVGPNWILRLTGADHKRMTQFQNVLGGEITNEAK